jgi:hypothetical protein
MANIKITCPNCGQSFQHSKRYRGQTVNCPHCHHSIPFRRPRRKFFAGLFVLAFIILITAWIVWPMAPNWPDRRPIGVLFLASGGHCSLSNPRGWFFDESLDFTSPGGTERFRNALLDYADTSIANLQRLGAQGAIVWDLEGEQLPHKITYIGDPRQLDLLAPEMAPVAAEFFKKFTDAGLRVGILIRPQQFGLAHNGPHQTTVLNIDRLLREKIDYARTNWGATLFFIDSNDSFWRPDEVLQLRLLAAQRPDVLLIPEHHYLPYWAFTAPYFSLLQGKPDATAPLARKLFPRSFQVINFADAPADALAAAWHPGDILLVRAWYWNTDCQRVEDFQGAHPFEK